MHKINRMIEKIINSYKGYALGSMEYYAFERRYYREETK